MKKYFLLIIIIFIQNLYAESFSLFSELKINNLFFRERNMNPNSVSIIQTPICINENEIGILYRTEQLNNDIRDASIIEKETKFKRQYLYNYSFEIYNLIDNSNKQFQLDFIDDEIDNLTIEVNEEQNNSIFLSCTSSLGSVTYYKYFFDTQKYEIISYFKHPKNTVSIRNSLIIDKSKILVVYIDDESSDFSYMNEYEEYIGKLILYNSIENENLKRIDSNRIEQTFCDSKNIDILISEGFNPRYYKEFCELIILTPYSLEKKSKETTIYIFKNK